ncbi:MAG: hypothetical protein IT434_03580, partial [Phycisphaerales bacterium]|nr:hypothetical protein [Phycisphaerales bacterium]
VNSGDPSGTDDNVTLRYTYVDGLRTEYKADLASNDQVTTYGYGVSKGSGGNLISSNRLLVTETYPDTGVVTYAYNAQGQVVKKTDQAGNVIDTAYDVGGRLDTTTLTTITGNFDTRVRRIERDYASTGLLSNVIQYDATTSGNVLDEIKYTHDGWLNLSKLEYDKNSLVGAGGSVDDYEISYAYSKATGGRQTVRRSSMTLPSGNVIDYTYSSSSSNDDAVSRLTELRDDAVSLVKYDYLGLGTVVGTTYDEPDVFCKRYAVANNAYSNLDRYNRIVKDTWTKDLSSDVNFYDCDIAWDRNSNITRVEDNVHTGFDVAYSVDDLDRITRAEEGTWNGSAITSRTRDQQWTLNHTGNWDREKLDLNGDGDFVDTEEHDDTRTHNTTNELLTRDLDSNSGTSGNNYSLDYDDVGNLVDDKTDYEYVYDPLGRLRKILKTSNQALVAEYYYDGLGQMVMRHEDTDADLDADASDKKYWLMQDERWRWVGTFRESDASPKEEYVHHQAGLDGDGESSYIDLVVLRNRDGDNAAWTSAADGAMEERIYYGQNASKDTAAVVNMNGSVLEWAKYRAYGDVFVLPTGDADSDGDCDANDQGAFGGTYDVREDVILDGVVDESDVAASIEQSLGHASEGSCRNRRSFRGYSQLVSPRVLLARNRVLSTSAGRWIHRDPIGYLSGCNLFQYVAGMPMLYSDPLGLSESSSVCLATEGSGYGFGGRGGSQDYGGVTWVLAVHMTVKEKSNGDCDGESCFWNIEVMAQPRFVKPGDPGKKLQEAAAGSEEYKAWHSGTYSEVVYVMDISGKPMKGYYPAKSHYYPRWEVGGWWVNTDTYPSVGEVTEAIQAHSDWGPLGKKMVNAAVGSSSIIKKSVVRSLGCGDFEDVEINASSANINISATVQVACGSCELPGVASKNKSTPTQLLQLDEVVPAAPSSGGQKEK